MRFSNYNFLLLAFLATVFASCNNTKYLQPNERLLVKSEISIEKSADFDDKRDIEYDLSVIPLQIPNNKSFGLFRTSLSIYNKFAHKKQGDSLVVLDIDSVSKFRRWVINNLGEPPVVYDPDLMKQTTELMQNYLFNKGYYRNQVTYEFNGYKRLKIKYVIEPNVIYHFDSIIYPKPVDLITKIINIYAANSLLKIDDPFDITQLKNERSRIAEKLQNVGYFKFNKELIEYEFDSSATSRKIKVYVKVSPPPDTTYKEIFKYNQTYVIINSELSRQQPETMSDTIHEDFLHFTGETDRYKLKVLKQSILFEKGQNYSLDDYQNTIKKLTNLGVFKYVSIEFRDVVVDGEHMVNSVIKLAPNERQNFAVDLEAHNNFDDRIGSAITFTYRNRNLSRVADQLQFNIFGGVEFQRADNLRTLLNTADLGTEVRYSLNQFLFPTRWKDFRDQNSVKTTFSARYDYDRRIEYYTQNRFTFAMRYQWYKTTRKVHNLAPVEVSLLQLADVTPAFQERLEQFPSLANSFQEQLIIGSTYSYLYNNRKGSNDRSYYLFEGDAELAGNSLYAGYSIFSNDTMPYRIGSRPYSQFVKLTGEIRHHFQTSRNSSWNSRFIMGVGLPYGNSTVLPYVKQYHVGGSNSVRAFRLRSIGPGGYIPEETEVDVLSDQTGDIKIEANTEIRFDVFQWIKGAFFIDAGNTWLVEADEDRPNAHFDVNRFYEEIAIGTGLGTRLDFTYFVLRFDFGVPVRNPSINQADKWVIKDWRFANSQWRRDNIQINLAVNYPF